MTPVEGSTLTTVAIVMVAYLGVLLLIGWRAARRTHGGEDFHLAGRSLGSWAAGISSTASSESGWVTLGAVGMTYTFGVSGLWYAPGCLLGYLVNVYFVAPRIHRLSRRQGSLTLADVVSRRALASASSQRPSSACTTKCPKSALKFRESSSPARSYAPRASS